MDKRLFAVELLIINKTDRSSSENGKTYDDGDDYTFNILVHLRRLHKEELHSLYRSPNTIRMIIWRQGM